MEFLITLRGNVMERGDFEVFADGRLRRNIKVFYPAGIPLPPTGEQIAPEGGYVRRYEQMFIPVEADTIRSSVHFLNEDGLWAPSFPGAEEIVMTRVGSTTEDGAEPSADQAE